MNKVRLFSGVDTLEEYATLNYVSKEEELEYLTLFEDIVRAKRKAFGRNLIGTIMFSEDTPSFRQLPKKLIIYRGYNEIAKREGISWSLSQRVAEGFANVSQVEEYKNIPASVVKGVCSLRDVLAYTNGCGEQEIIINPIKVKNIKNIVIGQSPKRRVTAEPLEDILMSYR